MPASGTCSHSFLNSTHVRRSHLLLSRVAILEIVSRMIQNGPDHIRADVGTSKWRGIFNIIVTGHMLAHDSDVVALVLGKKVGGRQARNTSTFIVSASFRIAYPTKTHPTTTIVFAILICHALAIGYSV